MREVLNIQKQLIPELTDVLRRRYTILNHMLLMGTSGRRTLAASLGVTERVLRAETDFLKAQNLIVTGNSGMRVSQAGEELLLTMEPMVKELFGLSDMEDQLCARFRLSSVTVVPGDCDSSPYAKKELGRAGGAALRRVVAHSDIIAVAGGSTMAEIANWLSFPGNIKDVRFVPARGGLGESLELQANTIASTMAKRTGSQYRLLHVPDHLGEDAYQSLMQEPNIQELVGVIRQARIVLHGIGEAVRMAERRKVDEATIEQLRCDGALAEAFGYYFDRSGNVLHKMPTVGLRLEDIRQSETVIAVAGGASKAEAIAAVMRFGHTDVLVTDEAAARIILDT